MSSPYYDFPDHFWLGVNADGDGPVDTADLADHWVCWCGTDGCELPEGENPGVL